MTSYRIIDFNNKYFKLFNQNFYFINKIKTSTKDQLINKLKFIMKKICTFFNSEESNSDNFAYNSSENLPLDENIDPDKDSKLPKVTQKKLKKKFCVSKEGKKKKR